jgi:hypothetical protein
MPTTFLDLCNQTLRRLNEVEIAPADFAGVRGVQALAKDAVRSSVAKVNQSEFEWPFNAAEHTDTLSPGQEEYSFPADLKIVDYNSFQIQKDDSLGVGFKALRHIDRDQWYQRHRDEDYEAGASGRGVPDFVFASHGNGYGVSPVPDAAYTLKFRYFLNFTDLVNADDQTRIPSSFDTLIVDGALYHMYMFKDNPESAGVSFQAFERGLKSLQSIYINDFIYVRDRRVNFGGGQRRAFNVTPVRF